MSAVVSVALATDADRAALERIRARSPESDPAVALPDVPVSRIPRHVAVIMDGNGRWASARGRPRTDGHRAGAASIRRTLVHAAKLGIEYLTLYSFSSENWSRPEEEVRALMELCIEHCHSEQAELSSSGVRVVVIGRREGLAADVVEALEFVERSTAECRRITVCLAINYGSRGEIADAARSLARDAAAGRITAESIDETAVSSRLYTAGMPDPDLLIRTGGEMRLSNYLLWQLSYAELHSSPVLWPDFSEGDLDAAVRDFATRHRKFGGLATP
ncbi:MAG: di-trans,poly-cis-decaprenylcistransferase [Phycisphaeraceae bacterium]|nr:di-trans,poly-cis-decaprenylcistransferase [Phycisphaeraceae bacterium]